MWDLSAWRRFWAPGIRILRRSGKMRCGSRSHTLSSPIRAHPGEGVNPLVSALLLPGEKINSLESGHFSILSLYV